MKRFNNRVEILCRVLDIASAICIAAMAALVTGNILLRVLWSRPLTGTMDIVNILMVLAISLALANCGLKNGHIAVEFIMEKYSNRIQGIIGTFIYSSAVLFWGVAIWFMFAYGHSMMLSNQLAGTVAIPLYPVAYLSAFGILALLLVFVTKLADALRMAVR